MDYNLFIYILIAITPGLLWLAFFLKKDNLPEPKIEIFKVFYFGIMAVIPAALIEINMLGHLSWMPETMTYYALKFIFIVALIEEVLKYLIIRYLVLKNSCFDEPIDIVIYMITSGLGFATGENLLLFIMTPSISDPIGIAITRFIGANFLHALCSAIIGIFIALSFYHLKQRKWIIVAGFILSIIIHATFNFSIQLFIINNKELIGIIPFIITITLSMFVIIGIEKVKKMKGVCKIN